MSRIQKRAICSLCGRLQAVDKKGRIADHGYTLAWSSHASACGGSRRPHFGTPAGRDFAASLVIQWRKLSVSMAASEYPKERRKAPGYLQGADELQRRVDVWAPHEPINVKVDERIPPVHLAGQVYRTQAAVCCASAMGALRFRGKTTDVEADVTCQRCMKVIGRRLARAGGAQ